jgi:hypothetical protein
MRDLPLRLALISVRAAPMRFVASVIGIAIGVVLLIGGLSIGPALNAQHLRLERREQPADPHETPGALLWAPTASVPTPGGEVEVVLVAPSGPGAPRPLGAPAIPRPTEVFASPALRKLMTRSDQVARLLPGPVVGTLSREVLADPSELLMVVGTTPSPLRTHLARVSELHGVPRTTNETDAPSDNKANLFAVLTALGLLVPIALFIRTSTRLSSARRDERLAAMWLVGADDRQVRLIAGVEAFLMAAVGVEVAVAALLGARAVWPTVNLAGYHFFQQDLRAPAGRSAAAFIGVPIIAVLTAAYGTRATGARALGVARQAPARPRWRGAVAATALAVVALAVFSALYGRARPPWPDMAVGVAFVALLAAVVLAGPPLLWSIGSRRAAERQASTLIAARRTRANARGVARTAAAVVAAGFVGAAGALYFPSRTAQTTQGERRPQLKPDIALVTTSATHPQDLIDFVRRTIHPDEVIPIVTVPSDKDVFGISVGIGTCAGLRRVLRTAGSCPIGATARTADAVGHPVDVGGRTVVPTAVLPEQEVFPKIDVLSADAPLGPNVREVFVGSANPRAAAETLRRELLRTGFAGVGVFARTDPITGARAFSAANNAKVRLALGFIGVLATMNMLVAGVDGVVERRRTLALLVATGTPTATLRRAVVAENVVPVVLLTAIGLALGSLFASMVLRVVHVHPVWSAQVAATAAALCVGPAVIVGVAVLPATNAAASIAAIRTE